MQKDRNRCFFSVQKLSSFLGQSSNNNNESTKFQVKRVKTCWTRENGSTWKINDLSSLLKRPIYAFFLLLNRKWKKLMPMLDGSVRWPGPKLWLVLNTSRPKTEGSFKLNETKKCCWRISLIVARFETNAWETCQLDFEFLNCCSNPSAPTSQATCLVVPSHLLLAQRPLASILSVPKIFSEFLDVYWQRTGLCKA